MKLKLFFSMMAIAAISFTGCNKQTELEINYGKTARLQGQVTIFEETGASSQVASGIKVYAEVPYSLLTTAESTVPSGSGPNTTLELKGDKIFETTTDEKGVYILDIPVTDNFVADPSNQGALFKVYTERKEMNEKFYYGEAEIKNFSTSVNSTTINNISMFATDAAEAVFVVKGKVEIDNTPDNNLPAAGFKVEVKVTVNNGSRTFTTTTNAQGEYEISVPTVDPSYISVSVPAQTVNGKDYNASSYPDKNPEDNGEVDPITVTEVPSSTPAI